MYNIVFDEIASFCYVIKSMQYHLTKSEIKVRSLILSKELNKVELEIKELQVKIHNIEVSIEYSGSRSEFIEGVRVELESCKWDKLCCENVRDSLILELLEMETENQ